jgi:maltose/moltooligosaccharide transporter
MEPFRAFVGDMLRKDQHTSGYAVQTAFIGAGAVVGSIFPWLLDRAGVSNAATHNGIPDTVRLSFWFGAAALLAAVLWTVLSTREYSPDEMSRFSETADQSGVAHTVDTLSRRSLGTSILWGAIGISVLFAVIELRLAKEMYLLAGLLIIYGILTAVAIRLARRGRTSNMLANIVGDFAGMPRIMKRLALVQFFSWSALFIMWIDTTPVVAQDFFHSPDPASTGYQDASNWVGVLFAVYNGVAAIAALALLPWLARMLGKARVHMLCLLAGAAGYFSFFLVREPGMLLLSELGIGIAWASILAMPYAILASSLPQQKLGIYMGLFNIFIVIPQLLVATVMGSIMKAFFPDQPIWTMLAAGLVMTIAALAMLRVETSDGPSRAASF